MKHTKGNNLTRQQLKVLDKLRKSVKNMEIVSRRSKCFQIDKSGLMRVDAPDDYIELRQAHLKETIHSTEEGYVRTER